jgi:hypothetical protein
MDIQTAIANGYYFDRCIDLEFFDTDMNLIAVLKTPKRGLKPTITIKGLLIEGGYAIDSYISIQNMAFDIDIAYVGFIKAHMYYSGLGESIAGYPASLKTRNGHTILYRVLYADQEKEPPNRCVRFQCVVASKDFSMANTPMYVSDSSLKYLQKGVDPNTVVGNSSNKSKSKISLKNLCEEIIKIYNEGIAKNSDAGRNPELRNSLEICLFEIDEPLEKEEVVLPQGEYKLYDFIRQLNSNAESTEKNSVSYPKFKIVIDRGCMRVTTPLPSNWKAIGQSKGYVDMEKYYNDSYASVKTNTYTVVSGALKKESVDEVIKLNFVKNATRSECVVYVETLFDDRITPGCKVAIRSNAIMGRKFGSSKGRNKGSRILNYLENDKPIVFRNTGKIEYLFSTTEDSYMKMQGPVDESVSASTWRDKDLGFVPIYE